MTTKALKRKKMSTKIFPMPIICLGITILMLVFSEEIKESIVRGISLAALRIIPTLFPFMVLSDMWVCSLGTDKKSVFLSLISKLLGISYEAVISLIIGIFCGFPLGVKSAANLYESKAVSIDELSHITPIVNLPSLAFVISGVGMGIYKSAQVGVLLYFSILAASILVGCFNRPASVKTQNTHFIFEQKFDLLESIKKAGTASLTVASYIIFFSGVLGLLSSLIQNETFLTIISTFLEIGNSTVLLAKCPHFSKEMAAILTAFALGFSGMSVHMQAFAFLPSEISKAKYLLRKFLIGIISSLIFALSLHFI